VAGAKERRADMEQMDTGPEESTTGDPDADPDMKSSGTEQPDQAEGEDDGSETQ
jgi:hypothetical protein